MRGSIVIPYVRDVSEKIKKTATKFWLDTAFHSHHILVKLLTVTKPLEPVFNTNNIIYYIPCECGCEYIGESCRSL